MVIHFQSVERIVNNTLKTCVFQLLGYLVHGAARQSQIGLVDRANFRGVRATFGSTETASPASVASGSLTIANA